MTLRVNKGDIYNSKNFTVVIRPTEYQSQIIVTLFVKNQDRVAELAKALSHPRRLLFKSQKYFLVSSNLNCDIEGCKLRKYYLSQCLWMWICD